MYRIIIILLFFTSCVYPYEFRQDEAAAPVVVEGYVSNNPGDSEVKLSRSGRFQRTVFDQVSDADVVVIENDGVEHRFSHHEYGMYKPVQEDFAASMESSYRLVINVDGQRIESDEVTMTSSLAIDSLAFEPAKDLKINPNLELFITSNTDEQASKHYIYTFEETWEVVAMNSSNIILHPVFKYDENRIPIDLDFDTTFIGNTTRCWAFNKVEGITTLSTEGLSCNQLLNLPLFDINLNSPRLLYKYSVLVNQYAINKEVYHFFNMLVEFSESSGLLYDTQPGYIEGNMHNASAPEKKVIGMFYAACHSSKRIFIPNHKISTAARAIVSRNYPSCDFGVSDPIEYTEIPDDKFTNYLIGLKERISDNGRYILGQNKTMVDGVTSVEYFSTEKYCADCRLSGTNIKPEWWE